VAWLWLSGLFAILWTILLALKLEQIVNFSWFLIFSPLWVSLILLYLITSDWPNYSFDFQWTLQPHNNTLNSYEQILPQHTVTSTIVFTVLLGLDLEGIYPISWWIKFLPFWWLIFLVLFIPFTAIGPRFGFLEDFLFPFLIVVVPFAFLILLGLKLTGVMNTYMAVVWIPFWIVELVAFFGACALPCIL